MAANNAVILMPWCSKEQRCHANPLHGYRRAASLVSSDVAMGPTIGLKNMEMFQFQKKKKKQLLSKNAFLCPK